MAVSGPEASDIVRGRHLILYDGLCELCNRANRFVLRRDRRRGFVFASLQSPTAKQVLERFGRSAESLTTFFVVKDFRSTSPALLEKGNAMLFVLENLDGVATSFRTLRLVPHAVLDFCYSIVARNRYRLFGRRDSCPMPIAEDREQFIDV